MKIIIGEEYTNKWERVDGKQRETSFLTDEGLNNHNYVSLVLADEETNEVAEKTISIDELYCAVKAFMEMRDLNRQNENSHSS